MTSSTKLLRSVDNYRRHTQNVLAKLRTCAASYSTVAPANDVNIGVKPFEEIPHSKRSALRTIVDTIKLRDKSHIALQWGYNELGKIYRVDVFGVNMVYLGDVDDVQKLHTYDGRTPQRMTLATWKQWRDESAFKDGILISSGAEWKRMRKELDKQMLRPHSVSNYTQPFNDVTTEFIDHLRQHRREDGSVLELDEKLFRWSLEGMVRILYESRLGTFDPNLNPEAEKFISSVHGIFIATFATVMPRWLRQTIFRKYERMNADGWNYVFTVGQRMIDNKVAEIRRDLDEGREVSGFLAPLLMSDKFSVDDIYANVSELMFAGVDTTSNTMQWVLYHLTKYPNTLRKLEREVRDVIPPGGDVTKEHIDRMPYLRAVIKEVLRLVPPANVVTRTTSQNIVLSGYHIPAGTLVFPLVYAMCRDAANFADPDEFRPERWLREEGRQLHSFAALPFGHGPRMCIGKRIAELEMHLLLARLVQQFDMSAGDNDGVHIVSKGLLVPNKAVSIKFNDAKRV